MISNKLYDVIKSIAMIYLPALTTLYFAISSIWGIPDTTNVIGTMTGVDTFLGAVLGVATSNYIPPTDGALVLDKTGAMKTVQIPMTQEEIAAKGTLTLQVQHDISSPPPA